MCGSLTCPCPHATDSIDSTQSHHPGTHTHRTAHTHVHDATPQSFGDRRNWKMAPPPRRHAAQAAPGTNASSHGAPRPQGLVREPRQAKPRHILCEPWPVRLYGANTLRAILHMLKRKFGRGNTRSANNSQLFPVPLQLDSSTFLPYSHFFRTFRSLIPLSNLSLPFCQHGGPWRWRWHVILAAHVA